MSIIKKLFLKLKYHETLLVILVVILTSLVTATNRNDSSRYHMGDSGQNYKVLNNIYEFGYPYNDLWPSLYEYVFVDQLSHRKNIGIYEKDYNIDINNVDPKKLNHFYFHTYFIAYILAPFVIFFDASWLLNFINCFSFISLLGLSYFILRRNKFTYFESFSIIFSFSLFQGWSQSFFAQPFFDTLFKLSSFLLLYFLYYKFEKKDDDKFEFNSANLFYLFLIFLFSILIVEKASIYVFVILVIYLTFFIKKLTLRNILFLSSMAFISLFYFLYLSNFFLENPYYKNLSPSFYSQLHYFFNNDFLLEQTTYFFIALLPFLFLNLIGSFKNFIFLLIVLSPNIFGSVGGSEKTGFYTHYHSLYIGVMFFLSLDSLTKLREKKMLKSIHIFLISLLTSLFFLFTNVTAQGVDFKFNKESFYKNYRNLSKNKDGLKFFNDFESLIEDKNSKIVVTEFVMPYLYKFNNLSFFPYNLNNSEYLIYKYDYINNEKLPYFLLPHKSIDEQVIVRQILLSKIKYYFDYDNPLYDQNNVIVLKKITN